MKMLVTTPFQRDPERLAALEQQHGMQFVVPEQGQTSASLIGDVDAAYGPITAEDFQSARALRWVQSSSAGVDRRCSRRASTSSATNDCCPSNEPWGVR